MSKNDTANIFLHLDDRFALSYDKNQWLVMRRKGKERWQAKWFVASNKQVLQRVLREAGCVPTPEAKMALDALPERFRDWCAAVKKPQKKAPLPPRAVAKGASLFERVTGTSRPARAAGVWS